MNIHHYRFLCGALRSLRSLPPRIYQPTEFLIPYRRFLCITRPISSTQDQDQITETAKLSKLPNEKLPLHIIDAPKLALENDQLSIFVENSNDWFKRIQSIVDDHPDQCNAAVILGQLGKINRLTNGRLSAKSKDDWKMIEYFLKMMIDGGFQRFEIENIVGALAGIRDFDVYSQSPITNRPICKLWLEELSAWITKLERTDAGYCFLERRSSYVLFLLSGLAPVRKIPPELLDRLCHLSKLFFDQRLKIPDDEINTTILVDEISCFYYSDAFLHWLHDPNSILKNSWKSWYGICGLFFETHLIRFRHKDELPAITRALRLASRYVSVAVEFGNMEEFWMNFHIWERILKEILIRYSEPDFARNQSQELGDARIYLPDLVYNLGLLSRQSPRTGDQYRNRFETVLPMLDDALANLAITDPVSHCRALTGFRNLKSPNFELSINYYRMIQDWCRRSKHNLSPKHPNAAATMMYLLREMKLRRNTEYRLIALEELVLLFERSIDRLDDTDLNRALSYFGDACLNFDMDPRRICISHGRDDIWGRYFEKAKHYLENCWPEEANFGVTKNWKDEKHALSIFADVAYRYRREEEFMGIYGIYEKRLMSLLNSISPSQGFYLRRTLNKMSEKGFAVNDKLLDGLARKADAFVPKHAKVY